MKGPRLAASWHRPRHFFNGQKRPKVFLGGENSGPKPSARASSLILRNCKLDRRWHDAIHTPYGIPDQISDICLRTPGRLPGGCKLFR